MRETHKDDEIYWQCMECLYIMTEPEYLLLKFDWCPKCKAHPLKIRPALIKNLRLIYRKGLSIQQSLKE